MHFNGLLRREMCKHRILPADLAKEVGATPEDVQRWLRGHGYPEPRQLLPLAERLGLTLDELCGVDSWTM